MQATAEKPSNIYGLLAEFETPEALTAATRRVAEAGYRQLDAYSPFPIEELSEVVTQARKQWNVLPYLVLGGGITGTILGFALQYFVSVIDYPLNIGGRPLNSWPAFVVVSFETTVLLAAFAAVFGMIILNGLPMPYHPVFNEPRFTMASTDKFFLCIEAKDPKFHPDETRAFLESLNPDYVTLVESEYQV
ncbi:MAG: DUF3341 domain-containing protein [Anaerolineae bacterium]|nr:DUF3341 domain-containing protein [Anaerolineae bacterium]